MLCEPSCFQNCSYLCGFVLPKSWMGDCPRSVAGESSGGIFDGMEAIDEARLRLSLSYPSPCLFHGETEMRRDGDTETRRDGDRGRDTACGIQS